MTSGQTLKTDWKVHPYEETTAPLPPDLLRPIPKQDTETHMKFELKPDGFKIPGWSIRVWGTFR